MKKIILVILVIASINFVYAQANAEQDPVKQEETTKKKKRGGFWNKVKKGVESTTGLDVSSETLFVYPEIGKWMMRLKSANASLETGELTLIIEVLPLADQKSGSVSTQGVIDGNNRTLEPEKEWRYGQNFERFSSGYTEFVFFPIFLEKGMKSLKSVQFDFDGKNGFEVRDVPITWVE